MSHPTQTTFPTSSIAIDFKRPVVEVFTSVVEELVQPPAFLATARNEWVNNMHYLEWAGPGFRRPMFEHFAHATSKELLRLPPANQLGFVRTRGFNPGLAAKLASDYDRVRGRSSGLQARVEDRRGFLYAIITLIDRHFGPIYDQAVKSTVASLGTEMLAPPEPVTLGAGGTVKECVLRSNLVYRSLLQPNAKPPREGAMDSVLFNLVQTLGHFVPGGRSPVPDRVNWLVLPMQARNGSEIQNRARTVALIDHLGSQAQADLLLEPPVFKPDDPYFVIAGHPEARLATIRARVQKLFRYLDGLPDGMPAILCFPELSAGPQTVTAIGQEIADRNARRALVPDLTFVGHTHRQVSELNRFQNEVHVFFGADRLDITFEKRRPYVQEVGDKDWMERINGSDDILLLDVPGYGRVTVAICKDYLGIVPQALFGLDVKLVIVPAMTSPTSVEDDFVPVARRLAGVGVTTMFINSGWHLTEDQLARCHEKHSRAPIAGFFFPIIRRGTPKLACHLFAPREVCGGIYQLGGKFEHICDIVL
jgi:hypothetical protein